MAINIKYPKLSKAPVPARTPQENIGAARARANATLGGIAATRGKAYKGI